MTKLYVIIPDITSGDAFNKVLNENGISTEYKYYKIAPRVIENKITTSKQVVRDLNKIFKTFSDKTRSVIIACNTLQLWLDDVAEKYKKHVKIYTTFEACEWRFQNFKNKPLWIGTTPLVERTTDFPTLLSLKEFEAQELVQELIWRLKKLYGDDIQTAPERVKNDSTDKKYQIDKIGEIKKILLETFHRLKIKNVIAGCTELPLIFNAKDDGINFIDPAQVLAEYVKASSVSILFAGGTISSNQDKNGTRYGGKYFDLIENLINKKSGSLKKINITKSKIVYSGLSENMNHEYHEEILTATKELLENKVSRIIITHGTDSMEQTANFLDSKLKKILEKNKSKVILTGSNKHSLSMTTDVWDNLYYAINVNTKKLKGGVYVAFNNRIIPASLVTKEFYIHDRMNFVSKESKTFERSQIFYQQKVADLILKLSNKFPEPVKKIKILEYELNIIRENHDKFLSKVERQSPRAVIFKLYHSGTANTKDKKVSAAQLVKKLVSHGIICFGATETGEPTNLHSYESSIDLLNAGMIPLYDMPLQVALEKLRLLPAIESKHSNKDIIQLMLKNSVGEIDEHQIVKADIKLLLENNYNN